MPRYGINGQGVGNPRNFLEQELIVRIASSIYGALGALLFTAGASALHAAEAPYYNPSNAASPSGMTTGHELYKTIGCPGRALLDPPCGEELAIKPIAIAKPVPAPVAAPVVVAPVAAPVPAPVVAPVVAPVAVVLDRDGDGVADSLDQCLNTPAGDRVDAKGCSLPRVMTLKGVNFDDDQATLRPDAIAILHDAVANLQRYPGMKIEVAGHTDSNSTPPHNLDLSERRAKAVMNYFLSKGIAADRLTSKGFGDSQPIAANDTATGRAENRRVELRMQN
jgi:outer membrane protein OmpA-like peptidoglycan-associated protein